MSKNLSNHKNQRSFEKMRRAGILLAQLFEELKTVIRPRISTGEIDAWVLAYLRTHGLVSQTIGYHGYQHASCISINDEVVHGVPSYKHLLYSGDIVTVDVCASWQGHCADMARCFLVGEVKDSAKQLTYVASRALDAGISHCYPGNRLGDVSAAIQEVVEAAGYNVVRDFAGHGIGSKMHEDPEILNYGIAGTGLLIQEGMAFAIEPMITEGSWQVQVKADRWTVVTVDHSNAAHVEDTVLVTANGPEIITRLK